MAAKCVIGEFRTTCSVYGEGNVKAGGCPVVITQWSEHMQLKPRALSSISVDCKLFTFSPSPHNNKHIKCSKVAIWNKRNHSPILMGSIFWLNPITEPWWHTLDNCQLCDFNTYTCVVGKYVRVWPFSSHSRRFERNSLFFRSTYRKVTLQFDPLKGFHTDSYLHLPNWCSTCLCIFVQWSLYEKI